MTGLLRRGMLEVETDLLLGVEDVLLPVGFVRTASAAPATAAALQSPSPEASLPQRHAPSRGFDAALFAPQRAAIPTSAAPLPRQAETVVPPQAHAAAPRPSPLIAQRSVARIEPRISAAVSVPRATTKSEQLRALEHSHAQECSFCSSRRARSALVFGEGTAEAELVLIGDAPSAAEGESQRPFAGRVGEKLDEMLRAIGLSRETVYSTTVLKAPPSEHRPATQSEIDGCGPYLMAQLAIIQPRVIMTLGGPATKLFLTTELGISALRGRFVAVRLASAEGTSFEASVMPTLHPAFLLRNQTTEARREAWEDLKLVVSALGRALPTRGEQSLTQRAQSV